MTDGRQEQSTRRTGISVEVEATGDKFQVLPLPWRKRNDLGQFIVQTYGDALMNAIRAAEDAKGQARIDASFFDKLMDYEKLFELALPNVEAVTLEALTWSEVLQICHALCEVNGLQNQIWMLDPNARSPETNTSSQSEPEAIESGQKTTSTEDSSTPESNPETNSSN